MKQTINAIFTIIIVLLLVWFSLSYVDILCNNLDGTHYADWNIIVKVLSISK